VHSLIGRQSGWLQSRLLSEDSFKLMGPLVFELKEIGPDAGIIATLTTKVIARKISKNISP
jgi:hypothetical protein